MSWTAASRQDRQPGVQLGWELIGSMVKRRRTILAWSQRDLAAACGLAQSAISRLETGRLSGVRFARFARLVAAMGGLDPDAPHPARPRRISWD
jgi:DNA-binding Xre family transcriptional regulator